jgi:hypothetical protein
MTEFFFTAAEFFVQASRKVFSKSLADQKKKMLKVALISLQCILKTHGTRKIQITYKKLF